MEVFKCSHDAQVNISEVRPNPKNPNEHSQDQIERLAKIIKYQGQRSPIVISKLSGLVVKGHGRLEAMKLLGWSKVAVDYQDYEDASQEYADVIADNAIAEWSVLDLKSINIEAMDLGPDFDLDLLGLRSFVVDPNDKNFDPGSIDDQGKLDELSPVMTVCPNCNEVFNARIYEQK